MLALGGGKLQSVFLGCFTPIGNDARYRTSRLAGLWNRTLRFGEPKTGVKPREFKTFTSLNLFNILNLKVKAVINITFLD